MVVKEAKFNIFNKYAKGLEVSLSKPFLCVAIGNDARTFIYNNYFGVDFFTG